MAGRFGTDKNERTGGRLEIGLTEDQAREIKRVLTKHYIAKV